MSRFTYGGQALIEGVLMRGRDAIAVALRHPDGRIVYATERLDSGVHGTRYSKLPFLRGLVVLYETLVVGTRWLVRSANVQAEEDGVELGKGAIALMLVITLTLGIGVFFLLPLFIATVTAGDIENDVVQHLIEGLVRVAIFLGYLVLISQMRDIKRVFQYHGAEHMTIHALEADDPLTVEAVRKYPTAHQRCGTEFLVVVIILSIFAFSLVGRQPPLVMIASRILLIPVIAAVGYEILRFGARHRGNPLVKVIMYPGILVQMITTKQPTDDMIEVAIVSMQEALSADGETIPANAEQLERDPMRLGPAHRRARRRRAFPFRRSPRRLRQASRPAGHDRPGCQARRGRATSTTTCRPGSRCPRRPRTPTRCATSAASSRGSNRSSPRTASSTRRARELTGAREMRDAESDDELRQMARDEIDRARGAEDAPARRTSASCCCRATRTTTAT